MAKRSGVNKSEAIRNLLAAKPGIAVKDVIATLKQKGIEVRDNLVYGIKQDLAKKASIAPTTTKAAIPVSPAVSVRVAPVKSAAPASNGHLGIGASIIAAKAAAEKVGGWAALKEIVDAMQ